MAKRSDPLDAVRQADAAWREARNRYWQASTVRRRAILKAYNDGRGATIREIAEAVDVTYPAIRLIIRRAGH